MQRTFFRLALVMACAVSSALSAAVPASASSPLLFRDRLIPAAKYGGLSGGALFAILWGYTNRRLSKLSYQRDMLVTELAKETMRGQKALPAKSALVSAIATIDASVTHAERVRKRLRRVALTLGLTSVIGWGAEAIGERYGVWDDTRAPSQPNRDSALTNSRPGTDQQSQGSGDGGVVAPRTGSAHTGGAAPVEEPQPADGIVVSWDDGPQAVPLSFADIPVAPQKLGAGVVAPAISIEPAFDGGYTPAVIEEMTRRYARALGAFIAIQDFTEQNPTSDDLGGFGFYPDNRGEERGRRFSALTAQIDGDGHCGYYAAYHVLRHKGVIPDQGTDLKGALYVRKVVADRAVQDLRNKESFVADMQAGMFVDENLSDIVRSLFTAEGNLATTEIALSVRRRFFPGFTDEALNALRTKFPPAGSFVSDYGIYDVFALGKEGKRVTAEMVNNRAGHGKQSGEGKLEEFYRLLKICMTVDIDRPDCALPKAFWFGSRDAQALSNHFDIPVCQWNDNKDVVCAQNRLGARGMTNSSGNWPEWGSQSMLGVPRWDRGMKVQRLMGQVHPEMLGRFKPGDNVARDGVHLIFSGGHYSIFAPQFLAHAAQAIEYHKSPAQ